MNIYLGSGYRVPLQLDKSGGDFCCSSLLLPLQQEIRQTERRLWSIQITKVGHHRDASIPHSQNGAVCYIQPLGVACEALQESWQLLEMFFPVVLTEA